jgi:hypothetical protein
MRSTTHFFRCYCLPPGVTGSASPDERGAIAPSVTVVEDDLDDRRDGVLAAQSRCGSQASETQPIG